MTARAPAYVLRPIAQAAPRIPQTFLASPQSFACQDLHRHIAEIAHDTEATVGQENPIDPPFVGFGDIPVVSSFDPLRRNIGLLGLQRTLESSE